MSEEKLKEHVLMSPAGKMIRVPGFLFEAFLEFVEKRQTGCVEVHFRDGGFASAECVARKSFKNGNGSH